MPRSVPFTVRPEHQQGLDASGLSDLEQCRSFNGGTVVKAKVAGRTTVKIERGGRTYFLKRIEGSVTDEITNEAHVLGQLSQFGLPVAEVAAVGAHDDFAALVTVGLPVRGTLEHELSEVVTSGSPGVSRRRRQLAAILRALHGVGVQHRDFYLTHILVGVRDDLYVADFGRARLLPRLGWIRRIKDLAALDYSTPARIASDWSRLRFLKEYAGDCSRWRLRVVAALARSKARAMRRHVERRIAEGEPNFHAIR